jgi:hypothetical protein
MLNVCGTEFLNYAITANGRLDITASVIDDNWTNVMATAGDLLTFNKETGYLLINANSIIADTRYQLDANTVIFSFDDVDFDGKKDANEAATFINFADLVAANAEVYADATVASNIKNVYHNDCVVFVNTATAANPTTKTALGIHSTSQIAVIENGEIKSWTISFNEISGAKTYKIANTVINAMKQPWAAGFTYMYTVNTATNEIIAFHEWNGNDFDRAAGLNGIYSMQLAGLSYEPTLGVMVADIFYEYTAKDDVVGTYTATARGNFIIDTSTKIRFMNSFGASANAWATAQGSAFNPYYDFEEAFYLKGYDMGWMKYEINSNGDAYVTELYLGVK